MSKRFVAWAVLVTFGQGLARGWRPLALEVRFGDLTGTILGTVSLVGSDFAIRH